MWWTPTEQTCAVKSAYDETARNLFFRSRKAGLSGLHIPGTVKCFRYSQVSSKTGYTAELNCDNQSSCIARGGAYRLCEVQSASTKGFRLVLFGDIIVNMCRAWRDMKRNVVWDVTPYSLVYSTRNVLHTPC